MKRPLVQVSTRELLLLTAVVALIIFGTVARMEASRTRAKIRAMIPACEIKVDYPSPEGRHALGGRFQLTGVVRFPIQARLPSKLLVRSYLKDPLSSKTYAEVDGTIRLHDDAGAHFVIDLPPPAILPSRPSQPGTYILTVEAFDADSRIAIIATPMTFVQSP